MGVSIALMAEWVDSEHMKALSPRASWVRPAVVGVTCNVWSAVCRAG